MALEFFDCNLYVGRPTRSGFTALASTPELIQHLDEHHIGQALVWHVAQRDISPVTGNAMLSAAIADQPADKPRLYGCWTLLPPQTREVLGHGLETNDEFFIRMQRNRVVALRAFPDPHHYLLERVVFGCWLDEVSERRIPLLLSIEKGIAWPAVYRVLEQYPQLTCVLCDVGIWGVDRLTWPLLEQYPNVYLDTSLVSLEDGGLEATVERYGAERLVFGTGYPERYVESAMLQLLHAEISEADKQKIAAGNLSRLIADVQLAVTSGS